MKLMCIKILNLRFVFSMVAHWCYEKNQDFECHSSWLQVPVRYWVFFFLYYLFHSKILDISFFLTNNFTLSFSGTLLLSSKSGYNIHFWIQFFFTLLYCFYVFILKFNCFFSDRTIVILLLAFTVQVSLTHFSNHIGELCLNCKFFYGSVITMIFIGYFNRFLYKFFQMFFFSQNNPDP